jgi:hypothetical protein
MIRSIWFWLTKERKKEIEWHELDSYIKFVGEYRDKKIPKFRIEDK